MSFGGNDGLDKAQTETSVLVRPFFTVKARSQSRCGTGCPRYRESDKERDFPYPIGNSSGAGEVFCGKGDFIWQTREKMV